MELPRSTKLSLCRLVWWYAISRTGDCRERKKDNGNTSRVVVSNAEGRALHLAETNLPSKTKERYKAPRATTKEYFSSISCSWLYIYFFTGSEDSLHIEAWERLFKPKELQTDQLNIALAEIFAEIG